MAYIAGFFRLAWKHPMKPSSASPHTVSTCPLPEGKELLLLFEDYKNALAIPDNAAETARLKGEIHSRMRLTHDDIVDAVAGESLSVAGAFIHAQWRFPNASSSYALLAYARSGANSLDSFVERLKGFAKDQTGLYGDAAYFNDKVHRIMKGEFSGLASDGAPDITMQVMARYLDRRDAGVIVLSKDQFKQWREKTRAAFPAPGAACAEPAPVPNAASGKTPQAIKDNDMFRNLVFTHDPRKLLAPLLNELGRKTRRNYVLLKGEICPDHSLSDFLTLLVALNLANQGKAPSPTHPGYIELARTLSAQTPCEEKGSSVSISARRGRSMTAPALKNVISNLMCGRGQQGYQALSMLCAGFNVLIADALKKSGSKYNFTVISLNDMFPGRRTYIYYDWSGNIVTKKPASGPKSGGPGLTATPEIN